MKGMVHTLAVAAPVGGIMIARPALSCSDIHFAHASAADLITDCGARYDLTRTPRADAPALGLTLEHEKVTKGGGPPLAVG